MSSVVGRSGLTLGSVERPAVWASSPRSAAPAALGQYREISAVPLSCPTVAADYGYRDGSGVHRVVERLEAKAKSDRALDRQLKRFVRVMSSVRS